MDRRFVKLQNYRLLCEFLLVMAILKTGMATHGPITQEDLDRAFKEAAEKQKKIRGIEDQLQNMGGIISKDTVSAESRHQGRGGTERSMKMNFYEEILRLAAVVLKRIKHLSSEEVAEELSKVNLEESGSNMASKVYRDCAKLLGKKDCDRDFHYRTIDGSCNNLNDSSWGQANSCFRRFLPAKYDDGIAEPRKSVSGEELPNAREVSTTIHNNVFVNDPNITLMFMQWGQFLDHDMTLTPMIRTKASKSILDCCPVGNNIHPACFPIAVSPNDTFFGTFGKTCMNLVRSSGCSRKCSLGPRDMPNVLTSCIDGSNIYGSSQEELDDLMDDDGLLNYQEKNDKESLPAVSVTDSNQCTRQLEQYPCFLAGDERVNEHPGLTSMHTVWLREHNRIARELRRHTWESDDEIFQKTRRIIGAMIQHIVYFEFLPIVLGSDIMNKYNLTVSPASSDSCNSFYDSSVDPTIMTDFATAPYRFGHTLIQDEFLTFGRGARGNLSLRDNFFNEEALSTDQMSSLVDGMCRGPSQLFDNHIVESVTNHLYKVHGNHYGLDLPAINIQRGRDHGIRPYVDYYTVCTGNNITGFDDLRSTMREDCEEKLPNLYSSVQDIDLFTGGLCEFPVPGGVVGPTFACIIAQQFHNLKFGDRFYYEHCGGEGIKPFNYEQLVQIKKVTLARVLCTSAKLSRINRNAFRPGNRINCDNLPIMDLSVF